MPAQSGQYLYPYRLGGWVTESIRSTPVGPITTTETVIQTVTFPVTVGIRYKITAVTTFQSSVANDLVQIRLRWSHGTVLAVNGAEIATINPNCDVAGRGAPATLLGSLVPAVTGQVIVGVTAVRSAGTGNITMFGSALNLSIMMVEAV